MVPRNDLPPPRPKPHARQPSSGKASWHYKSPAPSSFADDEATRSPSMVSEHEMLGDDPLPQYPGEDPRPTSQREIWGWYSYGFAAEVFVVCGVGSFIPITLEQLGREQGYLLSDPTKPCKGSRFDVSPPASAGTSTSNHAPRADKAQCIVHLLGARINTASFAMYTFALSVLIQALLIISISAAADHGRSRKRFLLSFAVTGAVSTMLFLGVVPGVYVLGAFLAIIANTSFGASFVLLNSFLPILVRRHPSIQPHEQQHEGSETAPEESQHDHFGSGEDQPSDSLLGKYGKSRVASRAAVSPALRLSTHISSYGIGIGYLAAVIVQTLGIILVLTIQPLTSSTTLVLRIVLFFIGLWWLVFTLPCALWLRPRPGPPLPFHFEAGKTWTGYLAYSWKSLWKTILRARRLKDMVLFLAAWFLLSDAIATISGTAVLFAKTDLEMKPAALALIGLTGTVVGVVGAFTWSKISSAFSIKPSQTIIACICLFEVIPLYGLLGYVPAIKEYGVFGLQQPWEMYPLGAIYGFVLGGISSYCRSVFSELIPPGFEAAFYALYAITDKGSSVFGPAIVGAITDRYGEIRPAFVFLAVLILLPLPLMLLVDVDRGKAEAARLADVLEGKEAKHVSEGNEDGTIRLVDEEEAE